MIPTREELISFISTQDTPIDSLGVLDLIMAIEDEFDIVIDIPVRKLHGLQNVDQLLDLIEEDLKND